MYYGVNDVVNIILVVTTITTTTASDNLYNVAEWNKFLSCWTYWIVCLFLVTKFSLDNEAQCLFNIKYCWKILGTDWNCHKLLSGLNVLSQFCVRDFVIYQLTVTMCGTEWFAEVVLCLVVSQLLSVSWRHDWVGLGWGGHIEMMTIVIVAYHN